MEWFPAAITGQVSLNPGTAFGKIHPEYLSFVDVRLPASQGLAKVGLHVDEAMQLIKPGFGGHPFCPFWQGFQRRFKTFGCICCGKPEARLQAKLGVEGMQG